jgi:hypothetical protein
VDIFNKDDKFGTIPFHTFKGFIRTGRCDFFYSITLEPIENLKRKFILSLYLSLKGA